MSLLECRACNKELAKSSDVFFYVKNDTQIFPSIKPEKVLTVKNNGSIIFSKIEISGSKKETKRQKMNSGEKLSCANCLINIGSLTPYGPNKSLFISFKRDSIKLCGMVLQKSKSKKEKFYETFKTVHQWKQIEHRTDDNFNGMSSTFIGLKDEYVPPPPSKCYLPSVQDVTRCSNNLSGKSAEEEENGEIDSEINKLFAPPNIVKTTPRPYQIAAYLQALIGDQIIVLPTGSGKTLIGTLLLVKLQILNPKRMGCFIVDRIPLMYQQGDYMIRETSGTLRVCMLCGESITFSKIRELLSGHYDILVITAGCLVNLVQTKKIDFNRHFHSVIFDECHHACNNHPYSYLLKEISKVFDKPRVVGLTASPVSVASSVIKTQNKLEELRSKFGSNAGIYTPDSDMSKISNNDIKVEQVLVSRSYSQKLFCCWVIYVMESFRKIVNTVIDICLSSNLEDVLEEIPCFESGIGINCKVCDEVAFDKFCSVGSLGRLRGKLNALLATLHYEDAIPDGIKLLLNRSLIPAMLGLVGTIEIIDILGPQFGIQAILELVREDRFHLNAGNLSKDIEILVDDIDDAYRRLDEKSFDEYFSSPQSMRLKRLEHELEKIRSKSDEQSRILILVRTRSIARDLHTHLCSKKEIHEYMHPEMCVGHGGYDGMSWEGEQELALAKFKSNDNDASKLLIATSVLEEGLDVAACDLVIRFQGVTDVISFIQSRGRARRKGSSRLFIFTTQNEVDQINKIRDGEITIQKFIKLSRGINYRLNDSMNRIEKELVNRIHSFREDSMIFNDSKAEELDKNLDSFHGILPPTTVWVPDKRKLNSNENFKESLQRSFEESGIHDLLVKHIIPVENAMLRDIFEHCCAYLVGLSYAGTLIDERNEDMLGEILRKHWSYDVASQIVWLQHEVKELPKEPNDLTSFCFEGNEISQICMGVWLGPNEFCEQSIAGKRIKDLSIIKISFTERNSFRIFLKTCKDTIVIDVSRSSIHDFALIDYADDGFTRTLFPLRSALPAYNLDDRQKFSPCANIQEFPFLNDFTANNVLSLRFANDANSNKIRQMMHALNLPFFETNVTPNEMIDTSKIPSNELEFFDGESRLIDIQTVSLPISLSDDYFSELQDIHWMIQSIFCQRLGCFTSEIKNYIWNFVCFTLNSTQGSEYLPLAALLFALSKCRNIAYWSNVKENFKSSFRASKEVIDDDTDIGNHASSLFYRTIFSSPDQNLFKLNNLIITPTRVLYRPPLFVQGCRLYRKFGSNCFFLCSFRNEHLNYLHGVQFKDLIKIKISNGIITCGGQKWIFFGASQSQLRDQKVLFINHDFIKRKCSYDTEEACIEYFRKQIIHHSTEASMGKYLSKLSLFCTADIPTIVVGVDEIKYKPDITTRSESPSTLTDGNGAISYSSAKEIALDHLKLKFVPTALQIRWRGVKGVLTVVPDDCKLLFQNGIFKKIMIRVSMIKCKVLASKEDVLCIVNYSKFYPMKVNREIISLLSSIRHKSFDPYPKLATLMEIALEKEAQILENPELGYESLSKQLDETTRGHYEGMSEHGNLTRCSLWIEMLQTHYRRSIQSLLNKSHISIENGCRLMGIPDPYGVLNDGEIFVKIDKGGKQEILKRNNLLIWRNPCLHPSHARIVNAVDNSALHSLTNVIIFPCHDNCLRNLPFECSQGDCDGDEYYVLWEDGLIPPRSSEVKPPVIKDGVENPPKSKYYSNLRLGEFVSEVFVNNCLGKIATMHLALSDHKKLGVRDTLCCDLAISHLAAVNFHKTGGIVKVPLEARKILRNEGYPDFMEKNVSYVSNRCLGLLYRKAKLFCFDYLPVTSFGKDNDYYGKKCISNSIDRRLLLPGRELFRHDAERFHRMYFSAIEQLMSLHGLHSEAEILLGCALNWDLLILDKGKASASIRVCFSYIQKQFRHLFHVIYCESSLLRKKQAASAWYDISLKDGNATSFYITVSNVLLQILNDVPASLNAPFVTCRIGRAIEYFISKEIKMIRDQIRSRIVVADFVRRTVILHRKSSLDIFVFGSVSQALCTEESDLDLLICASAKDYNQEFASAASLSLADFSNLTIENRQIQFYDLFLYPSFEAFSTSSEKVYETRVPIIRSQFYSGLISNCDVCTMSIDASCNVAGIIKTQWLQVLFVEDAAVYITFLILMRWFRAIDLIKGKSADAHSKMNSLTVSECHSLILHMLEKELSDIRAKAMKKWNKKYVIGGSLVKDFGFLQNILDNHQYLHSKQAARAGSLILTFFSNLSKHEFAISIDFIFFEWPCPDKLRVDGVKHKIPGLHQPSHLQNKIDVKTLVILRHYCDAARHYLLFCSDIDSFLNFSLSEGEMSILSKKLPTGLSYHIGTAQTFYAHHLSLVSGCDVHLSSVANEENTLRVYAQGNRRCIMKLKKKLNELVLSLNKQSSIIRNSSKYFMNEASGFWAYGSENAIPQIRFTDLNLVHNIPKDIDNFTLSGPFQKWNETSVCRIVETLDNVNRTGTNENFESYSNLSSADLLAIQELNRVLSNQIQKMPDRQNFSDIKLTIGFGNFVVINKNKWLPETRRSLSLKELLDGIDKNVSNRKNWDRQDLSYHKDDVERKATEQVINQAAFDTKKRKTKFMVKRKAKGIPTTFISTIDNVSFGESDSAGNDLLKKLEESLERCGYNRNGTKTEHNSDYQIHSQISKGYEIRAAYYDISSSKEDKQVALTIRERALNWVSFTVLGNGNIPDGRFRLRTYTTASEKLRRIANVNRSPIFWENKASTNNDDTNNVPIPKFYPDTTKENQKKIFFIQRRLTEKRYEKSMQGQIIRASITYEIQYWRDCHNHDGSWNHHPCYRIELDLSSALDELHTNYFNDQSIASTLFLAYKELAVSLGELMTMSTL